MLFNSYEFLFAFLPITFFVYFYLNQKRLTVASKGFLVFASLFFYSWWDIVYLPLILSSILFNYVCGAQLSKKEVSDVLASKKNILIFGIIANLSLLGYFKYADFFISNVNLAVGSNVSLLNLALPLAISFFTFQQITYLVDSYRGLTKSYGFLNYAVFVTFFPQLIAGPIVHHSEMMPQFHGLRSKVKNYRNIFVGLFIFSIGLFKKVVIADTFAVWATHGFDVATSLNFFESWATSLSYTFQLYFDFSGYSDMAIGLALLFNIKLPINFNSPYKATSIQDFWRRWHMTLSRFLRDYVYIPLGGNRKGEMKAYTNIMATFILGGIWHGAGWTFVFWGLLHGLAITIHRAWARFGFRMNRVLAWFITFNFINISWVFFRGREFSDAIKVLSGMFGMNGMGGLLSVIEFGGDKINSLFTLLLSCIVCFMIFNKNSQQLSLKVSARLPVVIFMSLLFSLSILSFNKVSEFLYFNF